MSELNTPVPPLTITRRKKTFLHPTAGLVVLALDWLLFGSNVLAGMMGTVPLSLLGFTLTSVLVLLVQLRLNRDSASVSGLKSVLSGVLVALPFPIGGTILGGIVLALAGLQRSKLGPTTSLPKPHD